MSVQAITLALDYAASGVAEKVILLVLANYANEYGYTPEAPMRVIPSAAAITRMEECLD